MTDRMAHAVLVNCEFVRQHLQNNEGVPAARIRLCYNGVDLEEFHAGPTPRDSLTIGVVCALRPEKDIGTLIEAFARIDAFARINAFARIRRPGLRLLIVGGGSMLGQLRAQAETRGLAGNCTFVPTTADRRRVAARHRHFRSTLAIGGVL